MPPVLWNFDGNVLVVKIIGSHTTADISRAFTEAMIECPTGATLLVDIRSAFISISPDVLNERVRLISDSIRGKISRYAIVTMPQGMVSLPNLRLSNSWRWGSILVILRAWTMLSRGWNLRSVDEPDATHEIGTLFLWI